MRWCSHLIPAIPEGEAGGLPRVQDQPDLCSECQAIQDHTAKLLKKKKNEAYLPFGRLVPGNKRPGPSLALVLIPQVLPCGRPVLETRELVHLWRWCPFLRFCLLVGLCWKQEWSISCVVTHPSGSEYRFSGGEE